MSAIADTSIFVKVRKCHGYNCRSRIFNTGDEITLASIQSLGNVGASWYWFDGDKDRNAITTEDDVRAAVYHAQKFGGNRLVLTNFDRQVIQEILSRAGRWCSMSRWKLVLLAIFVSTLFLFRVKTFALIWLATTILGAICYRCVRFGTNCVRAGFRAVEQQAQQQQQMQRQSEANSEQPRPCAPPHPLAESLKTLASLGFTDTVRNVRALQETKGDLGAAVTILLDAKN